MAQHAGLHPVDEQARLADSRAQFVSSLGRRLEALRQALRSLEGAPRSPAHRDNLRRRVHAMGAAAGVLGFEPVHDAFKEVENLLSQATAAGTVTPSELAEVARTLDRVPALVLGTGPDGEQPQRPSFVPSADGWPLSVLVFGPGTLAEAFASGGTSIHATVECTRTEDASEAEHLVRMLAPDLAVVDSDRRGAREFIQRLAHDPLLDPVRVLAVGTFDRPEAAASLVTAGVARVLAKPVTSEALRRAVSEVARDTVPGIARIDPIGTATVEALSDRIATEVRRGLVESVQPLSRDVAVVFGDGTDVLAAVWAAVARVRELTTMRSAGAVRFEASGPEGAVPLAPWMAHERTGSAPGAASRSSSDVDLDGRHIVVADDDPAVVWFLSGLLKATGAVVHEAHDGAQALELVYGLWPQLVITDILMPKLDGFALCRAIKRDIVLSDLPVILLSWKEDLLQRVRELGADADGYLRKEATASVVVQRVREVLKTRARVERRVLEGDARGRFEGLTPRLVLEAVCERRMDAQVTIRDAAFLYEVDIRGGRVQAAARAATAGHSEQGELVMAPLLGVRAGRFAVRTDSSPCRREFDMELRELLEPHAKRARAAQSLLSGASLLEVGRVYVDESMFGPYLDATPRQARAVVARLQDGESPKDLLMSGQVSAPWMESVLADLVMHGAVRGISAPDGTDMLEAALSRSAADLVEAGPTDLGPPSAPKSAPFAATAAGSAPENRSSEIRRGPHAVFVGKETAEAISAALDAASEAIDAWETPEGAAQSPGAEEPPPSSGFAAEEAVGWVDESLEEEFGLPSSPFVFAKETSPLAKALTSAEQDVAEPSRDTGAAPAATARESLKAAAPPKPQAGKKPAIPLPDGRRTTPNPAAIPLPKSDTDLAGQEQAGRASKPEPAAPSPPEVLTPISLMSALPRVAPPTPVDRLRAARDAAAPSPAGPAKGESPKSPAVEATAKGAQPATTKAVEMPGEDDAVDAAFLGLLESSEEAAASERFDIDSDQARPFFSKPAPPVSAPREPSPFEAALRSLPEDVEAGGAKSVRQTSAGPDWSIAFEDQTDKGASSPAAAQGAGSPKVAGSALAPTPPPKPVIRHVARGDDAAGIEFGEALVNAVRHEEDDAGLHDRVTIRPEDRITTRVGATPAVPPIANLKGGKGRFTQTLPLGFPAAGTTSGAQPSRMPPPKPVGARRTDETPSQPKAAPPAADATAPPLPVGGSPPPSPIETGPATASPSATTAGAHGRSPPPKPPMRTTGAQLTPTPPPLPITETPEPAPGASPPPLAPPLPEERAASASSGELDGAPEKAMLLSASKRISAPPAERDADPVVLPPSKRIRFPADRKGDGDAVELSSVVAELQGATADGDALVSTLMSASPAPAVAETPSTSGPKTRRSSPDGEIRSKRSGASPSSTRRSAVAQPREETRLDGVRNAAVTVLLTVGAAAVSFATVRAVRVHFAEAPVAAGSGVEGPASAGSAGERPATTETAPAAMASTRVETPSAASAAPGKEPVPSVAPSGVPTKMPALKVRTGLSLPTGLVVAPDKGLLDFDTGAPHSIYVDGVFVGRGPVRRVPLKEGEHEARLSLDGEESGYKVRIQKGQRTLVSGATSTGP